ncbi:hypothetical protein K502DRAFT_339515 [Neoconidiobolus thromboides FSU 785]|nr:hypothetical protein K502DRAFT_339515 [Neoconidiobolus thromboides FSU 785]
MGKSKKKQKSEDFKKPKLKVGKKKGFAENHTDTSFKSKTISLPNQSVTLDKSQQITTSRNLTIKELFLQLKHNNANVRKDAVLGIKELLNNHQVLLLVYIKDLTDIICRMMLDEDPTVRKLSLELCEENISSIKKETIAPYLDKLILYTCNGMTHLYEDIREDAMLFLTFWLKLDVNLAKKYNDKILPNFFQLLKIGSITKASHEKDSFSKAKGQIWSKKSRVKMLENLESYLNLLSQDALSEDWYLQSFLNEKNIKLVLNEYQNQQKVNIIEQDYLKSSIYMGFEYLINNNSNFLNDLDLKKEDLIIESIPTLYESLMSFWVETYSNVLINTTRINYSEDLKCLNYILKLILWIWRYQIHQIKDFKNLSTQFSSLKKFVLPYFPFASDMSLSQDSRVSTIILEMNIIVIEISGLYLLIYKEVDSKLFQRIFEHLLTILSYKKDSIQNISLNYFNSILPSLAWFLNSGDKKTIGILLEAIIDFSIYCVNTQVQYECIRFLSKIIQLQSHPDFNGTIKLFQVYNEKNEIISNWIIKLMKLLTNNLLNKSSNEMNKVIIKLWLHIVRFENIDNILIPIQNSLIDLFIVKDQSIPLFNLNQEDLQLFFNSFSFMLGLSKALYNQFNQLKKNINEFKNNQNIKQINVNGLIKIL